MYIYIYISCIYIYMLVSGTCPQWSNTYDTSHAGDRARGSVLFQERYLEVWPDVKRATHHVTSFGPDWWHERIIKQYEYEYIHIKGYIYILCMCIYIYTHMWMWILGCWLGHSSPKKCTFEKYWQHAKCIIRFFKEKSADYPRQSANPSDYVMPRDLASCKGLDSMKQRVCSSWTMA